MQAGPNTTYTNKEIALLLSQLQSDLLVQDGEIQDINQQINQIQQPTIINVPQAVNQIFNGSFTHSVRTWANSGTADDGRYECKNWYSHPVQVANQQMYANTTLSGDATITFTDTDVTTGVGGYVTKTTHGLGNGLSVILTSASPPAPLVTATEYFIIFITKNRFAFALTAADAIAGTEIVMTTTGGAVTNTLAFNYTLKEDSHTHYSEAFSDWSWTSPSAGCGRFQGSNSIDAIIPGNNIEPGYTFYGAFDIVKRNQYVTASSDERIWCGLYAEQDNVWDWIKGDFEITATVLGSPAGTTSRDYRILAKTDRGFTVLSSVLTVAGAPNDASFTAGARVFLQWKNVLVYGVQTYEIYRLTGATYVLLQTITTGLTQTLDNNASEASAAGWPTGTFDNLVAYTATIPNIIDELPYSGDPLNPLWATIPFTLKVPQNYDMSLTDLSLGQWLRWGFSSITGNLDLHLTDGVTTNGDFTLTSAAGQFSSTDPDMTGLTITLTYTTGDIFTTTIASVTSATEVELTADTEFTDTNVDIYITNGAPSHSLFVDLAHLTYIQGAAFSPNAADIDGTHGLPPVAPNGTTQGGSGGGQPPGSGDGQPVCLYEEEMVQTSDGDIIANDLRKGMALPDGYGGYNIVKKVTKGVDAVWLLETENGCMLKATATKRIFTPSGKKTLAKLKKGDKIYTSVNGVLQESPIFIKEKLIERAVVIQIGLKPKDSFLAGSGAGYVLCSNSKPIFNPGDPMIT